jgi:flagellar basal-body rod protein FlgB
MSPINPILGGTTSQLVSVALDAALARHAAIAANIANVDTPNYRPLMARFDQLVADLQGRVTDRTQDGALMRDAARMQDSLQSTPLVADPSAPQVELDMQMADLARNTVQYQALLTAQGKLASLTELAISEGKM